MRRGISDLTTSSYTGSPRSLFIISCRESGPSTFDLASTESSQPQRRQKPSFGEANANVKNVVQSSFMSKLGVQRLGSVMGPSILWAKTRKFGRMNPYFCSSGSGNDLFDAFCDCLFGRGGGERVIRRRSDVAIDTQVTECTIRDVRNVKTIQMLRWRWTADGVVHSSHTDKAFSVI